MSRYHAGALLALIYLVLLLVFGGLILVGHTAGLDSRVYGLLELGSSTEEIIAKVGPPDQILAGPVQYVHLRGYDGRRLLERRQAQILVYMGDRMIPTYLTFIEGVLIKKEKH